MYVHYLSGEVNDNHVKQVANAEKDRQISLLPLYVAAAVMFIYCIFVIAKSSYRELKGRDIMARIRSSRRRKTNQVENIPLPNDDVPKFFGLTKKKCKL